jgi:hypothetical protein
VKRLGELLEEWPLDPHHCAMPFKRVRNVVSYPVLVFDDEYAAAVLCT